MFKRKRLRVLALATIFATSKDPSAFTGREDFVLNVQNVVINNCASETILNDRDFFDGNLRRVTGIGIIAVGGKNHQPIHTSTEHLSWKDDKGCMHDIELQHSLYFLSSPVNVVVLVQLRLHFGDGM